IYLAIDGTVSPELPPGGTGWRNVEIDASRRISSGKVTLEVLFDAAMSVASTVMSLALSLLPTEAIAEPSSTDVHGLPEGARVRIEVNRYERNPANRAACI